MAKKAAAGVEFIRPEVQNMKLVYLTIRDCIAGEPAIKGMIDNAPLGLDDRTIRGARGGYALNPNAAINTFLAKRYLPQPNPTDTTQENQQRYISYIQRAVFYEATARTLDGMIGQVFEREPVVELPDLLQPMQKNVDGNGLNDTQFASKLVSNALPYGRCGLLVDFPPTNGGVTAQQLKTGEVSPILKFYAPWDVINWRTEKKQGKDVLTLVVLREIVENDSDAFQLVNEIRYRELRLVDGTYVQKLWTAAGNKTYNAQEISIQDSQGKPLSQIPFTFIGAVDNTAEMDRAPFYGLASLNLAHYRNSADYEESCFLVGQPTPVLSGLDQDWVDNVLKGSVQLGSRASIPLPAGATADLLQAESNTLVSEAMEKKERQMVALGAQLIQEAAVQRTATESIAETSAKGSTLSKCANNVSTAMTFAFKIAAGFVGADPEQVKYELNTQFDLMRLTADDVSKVISTWQKGGLTFSEMRSVLRKAGMATTPDAEAKTLIEDEMATLTSLGPLVNPFSNVEPPPPPDKPNPTNNPKGQAKTATKAAAGKA